MYREILSVILEGVDNPMKRLITAVILIPLLYLYVTKLPEGYFFGLLSVVALIGLYEFYRMFRLKRDITILSVFAGLLVLYILYKDISQASNLTIEAITFSFLIVAAYRMLSIKDPANSLRDTSLAIAGIVYVVVLISFQLRLRHTGPEWIIFLYGTIWLSDSSAYYIGTYLGRRKLYPQLSPNKTVEGAIGSVAGGLAGSYILGMFFLKPSYLFPELLLSPPISLKPIISGKDLFILGIIIGICCVIGDLIESMYKRDAGVKDSSSLIPGHGGILDKIDSSLVVAPVVYLYISLI